MKKILGYLILLLAILFVWHSLSPYPFSFVFRMAIDAAGEQGNLGDYAEQANLAAYDTSFSTLGKGQPNAVVRIYKPKNAKGKLPVLLWFHGGGWVSGSTRAQSSYLSLLASHGIAVASIDYALAPENPFPVATEQGILALNRLFLEAEEWGIDRDRIYVGGNSAGATIAAQLGAIASNKDYASQFENKLRLSVEKIQGLLLLNGVYNFATVSQTKFPFVDTFAWAYLGNKNYSHPSIAEPASVIDHIWEGFPRSFITAGDADPLYTQSESLSVLLSYMNIENSSLYWEDKNLSHDYFFDLTLPEAQEALAQILAFLGLESR